VSVPRVRLDRPFGRESEPGARRGSRPGGGRPLESYGVVVPAPPGGREGSWSPESIAKEGVGLSSRGITPSTSGPRPVAREAVARSCPSTSPHRAKQVSGGRAGSSRAGSRPGVIGRAGGRGRQRRPGRRDAGRGSRRQRPRPAIIPSQPAEHTLELLYGLARRNGTADRRSARRVESGAVHRTRARGRTWASWGRKRSARPSPCRSQAMGDDRRRGGSVRDAEQAANHGIVEMVDMESLLGPARRRW